MREGISPTLEINSLIARFERELEAMRTEPVPKTIAGRIRWGIRFGWTYWRLICERDNAELYNR